MSHQTSDPYDSEETEREYNPYPSPQIEVIGLYGQLRALRRALTAAQRAYADLVAACRAALTARREGEPDADAWAYIEDELPPPPPGHPLHPRSGGDGNPDGGGR